jgi:hypothetical protein
MRIGAQAVYTSGDPAQHRLQSPCVRNIDVFPR